MKWTIGWTLGFLCISFSYANNLCTTYGEKLNILAGETRVQLHPFAKNKYTGCEATGQLRRATLGYTQVTDAAAEIEGKKRFLNTIVRPNVSNLSIFMEPTLGPYGLSVLLDVPMTLPHHELRYYGHNTTVFVELIVERNLNGREKIRDGTIFSEVEKQTAKEIVRSLLEERK